MTLTPLTPADFATVTALAERIWRQHYASIVSMAQIDYMLADRYTPEKLSAYLGAADRGMLLLRVPPDDEAVGYVSYRRVSPDEMRLEQLYVLADRRGQGLGRAMMDHVEAAARAHGCARVMLQVNKQNASSIAVYRQRGFVVREDAVFDIGHGFVMDDHVMVKTL